MEYLFSFLVCILKMAFPWLCGDRFRDQVVYFNLSFGIYDIGYFNEFLADIVLHDSANYADPALFLVVPIFHPHKVGYWCGHFRFPSCPSADAGSTPIFARITGSAQSLSNLSAIK